MFRNLDDDPQSSLRWAIGNALEVVADDQVSDDLIDLAADRRYGTARQMIVLALGKTRNPRAVTVLRDVLDDSVAGNAVQTLGALRPPGIRAAIEPFTTHPHAWIRKRSAKSTHQNPPRSLNPAHRSADLHLPGPSMDRQVPRSRHTAGLSRQ